MLPYKRSERLGLLLREVIAEFVMRKIKDPRLGFVTVTGVELTEDLKIVRVFISVFRPEERDQTLEILNVSKGLIRSEIARKVRLKFIPEVQFRFDESIDRGERIDRLLREIKESHEPTPTSDESPQNRE